MIRLVVGLILLSVPSTGSRVPSELPWGQVSELGTRNSELHDTHVSHTRMVVEGTTIACRVRLFKDDLERALRVEGRDSTLKLTESDQAVALFGKYFGRAMRLSADGHPVALAVTSSGTEKDEAAQEIVWYVLEGTVTAPVKRLTVLDGLLFEYFRDQQNILVLLRLPEDQRQTLYFVASDAREQGLSF